MTTREQRKIKLEKVADLATQWIGSISSLVIHSIFFIIAFLLPLMNLVSFERMLLVLTTVVSLEAIYLAIFIQMSVNKNSQDIEIIQENVEEIQEDIEEIEENIDEIQKDVDEIQEDIESDVEEEEQIEKEEANTLASIQSILLKLQEEIEVLKRK
jgi:peptidoglycan hydrolase CwlO-like protein